MKNSKVTALINGYTQKSITIAVAFIALFCLSGCWESSTDLIPDRDAVNPFESAKYILFGSDNPTDPGDTLLLQRKSGKNEIFILIDPSDPSDLSEPSAGSIKFYNIGGYFGPKKYILGFGSDDGWLYCYVTENKVYEPKIGLLDKLESEVYGPESGLPDKLEVNSISEIKESINSGIKLDFVGELRAISSIQAAQLRQEMINRAGRVFRDALKDGGEGPEMVVLPTGSFRMGSPASETGRGGDEGPVRTVTINKRIAMGKYEVTFADYERFTTATSRARPIAQNWGRGTRPVINVSWSDAKAYAAWLSEQTGKRYRLPSESEWEYAARAGTETAYSWGDSIGCSQARYGRRAGGECSNSLDGTVPVGSFAANAFGLFDMHGNVREWVEDCYHNNYEGAPTDGRAWTSGCGSDVRAVVRGGSWGNFPRYLRAAARHRNSPSYRFSGYGFRLVQDLNP